MLNRENLNDCCSVVNSNPTLNLDLNHDPKFSSIISQIQTVQKDLMKNAFECDFPCFGQIQNNESYPLVELREKEKLTINDKGRTGRRYAVSKYSDSHSSYSIIDGVKYNSLMYVDPIFLFSGVYELDIIEIVKLTESYKNSLTLWNEFVNDYKEMSNHRKDMMEFGGDGYSELFQEDIEETVDKAMFFLEELILEVESELNELFFQGKDSKIQDLFSLNGIKCFYTDKLFNFVVDVELFVENSIFDFSWVNEFFDNQVKSSTKVDGFEKISRMSFESAVSSHYRKSNYFVSKRSDFSV